MLPVGENSTMYLRHCSLSNVSVLLSRISYDMHASSHITCKKKTVVRFFFETTCPRGLLKVPFSGLPPDLDGRTAPRTAAMDTFR